MLAQVLQSLENEDDEAKERDAKSAVPRAFRFTPPSAKSSRTDDILMEAQDMFLRGRPGPEAIIAVLGNAIEEITKRVWPERDTDPRSNWLSKILQTKANYPKNKFEESFAKSAIFLYNKYRKPAEHNPVHFRCSYDDAKFFYSGIVALNSLGAKIISQRPGDGTRK